MTPQSIEFLREGAQPPTAERWIALGCGLVLFTLWAVIDRRVRRALPPAVKRRWLWGAVTFSLLLAWQAPWLKFESLHAFGKPEQATYVRGVKFTKRVRISPFHNVTIVLCDSELRSSRGEEWSTVLKENACDDALPGRTVIPVLVLPVLRLVHQQGRYAELSFYYEVVSVLIVGTLSAILVLMSRRSRGPALPDLRSIRYYEPHDVAEGRPFPPISSRTYAAAAAVWAASPKQKADAPLPSRQQWVEFLLYDGGRPGEYDDWGMLPIGPRGNADPNDAEEFWVRVVQHPRAPHDRGELYGPYPLRRA